LAVGSQPRHSAQDKERLLQTMTQAAEHTGWPQRRLLNTLGLPAATYYRWRERAEQGQLADRVVVPEHTVLGPTPQEIEAVCACALQHPNTGYKRLSFLMLDADLACLRAHQVYRILQEHNLLARRGPQPDLSLGRPPEPEHADQVWHTDLMYLFIRPRWYYLVDILDGYSRFLVHWSLNLSMRADTVTLTVQQALERLAHRAQGEPQIVHDHGSQFLSAEWRSLVAATGVTDIRTRVAHPQSNGRIERLHRTHREEGLSGAELGDYYQALDTLRVWERYYNYERPHSALQYLRPIDYYRGDPKARLQERQDKLLRAEQVRQAYWQQEQRDTN
jgi:putative transposase